MGRDCFIEIPLDKEEYACLLNIIDSAKAIFKADDYYYKCAESLEKALNNYIKIKKYSDTREEYISLMIWENQIMSLITLSLFFNIVRLKETHTANEYKERIEYIKTNEPEKVWKYKE